jgi:hypothetical protein
MFKTGDIFYHEKYPRRLFKMIAEISDYDCICVASNNPSDIGNYYRAVISDDVMYPIFTKLERLIYELKY